MCRRDDCAPRGIIPARAGFTTARPPPASTCTPDHPRSRGVYPSCWIATRGLSGSSPLARGLPPDDARFGVRDRIIPARAGFTVDVIVAVVVASGSSPLARGLPTGLSSQSEDDRIIPARAGFTAALARANVSSTDHPRSRGVYGSCMWPTRRPLGSSPLARGLPSKRVMRSFRDRIIPARAGFTGRIPPRAHGTRDHPRSRGVYSRCRSRQRRG